jgi:hypothetical protein
MSRNAPLSIGHSLAAVCKLCSAVAELLALLTKWMKEHGHSPPLLDVHLRLTVETTIRKIATHLREHIAMATAAYNQFTYCVTVQSNLGKNFAKPTQTDLVQIDASVTPRIDLVSKRTVKIFRNSS